MVDLVSLQNRLSSRVPFDIENRVGNVIFRKKLRSATVSKKSLNISFSFVLSRVMLKSPAIITSLLLSYNKVNNVANSSVNCL